MHIIKKLRSNQIQRKHLLSWKLSINLGCQLERTICRKVDSYCGGRQIIGKIAFHLNWMVSQKEWLASWDHPCFWKAYIYCLNFSIKTQILSFYSRDKRKMLNIFTRAIRINGNFSPKLLLYSLQLWRRKKATSTAP